MGYLALIITCLTWECEWQGCMLKVKSKTVWLHLQNQQTSVEVNQTLVTHPLLSAQIVDKALKCLSKHKHISLGLKATPFCAVYVSIKQPHLSLLWFTRECQDSKQRRIPPGTLHLLGLGCQQPPKNLWQQHFSDFTGRVTCAKGKTTMSYRHYSQAQQSETFFTGTASPRNWTSIKNSCVSVLQIDFCHRNLQPTLLLITWLKNPITYS